MDCGPDWTREAIETAVARGPHLSALNPEARALVQEDVQYQVDAGFSEIVLWDDYKVDMPSNLKISPLAVVPQANRRGRLILDLSFGVYRSVSGRQRGPLMQESVNDTTERLSPPGPIHELGKVLPRIIDFMASTPLEDEIMFSKIDLSDGFWRIIVNKAECSNFAYVLPDPPGHPIRLVIPHALQMGWAESPGYFCAATETGRDVMQAIIEAETPLPAHPLETYMTPTTPAKRQEAGTAPNQMSAVFVDDYCLAAVESQDGQLLQRISRAALHTIHGIFPPPSVTGHKGGKDPVSLKKLEKGDARWSHLKEILGFMLDGRRKTVRLPNSKADTIVKELTSILKKRRVPVKRMQKIVGKLQHASLVMPSSRALFTPLYKAMKDDPQYVFLPTGSDVRQALRDFIALTLDAARRPTSVHEIIANEDNFIGCCDASAFAAGGVWFGGTTAMPPTVWRVVWPKDISEQVVSDSNPTGTLTNSDLELAGILIHNLVLETIVDTRHQKSVTFCDNTPSVAWATKLTSQAGSNVSYHLLRALAMRQRTTESVLPEVLSIEGDRNKPADIASRQCPGGLSAPMNLPSTGLPAPCDVDFLAYFNSRFPLPQRSFWRLAHPNSAMLSKVIWTLRHKRLQLRQWTTMPGQPAGPGGSNTPPLPARTPTWLATPPLSCESCSWPLPPGFEPEFSAGKSKLDTKLLRKPCVTWRKKSCWLDSKTHDEHMVPRNWIFPSDTS